MVRGRFSSHGRQAAWIAVDILWSGKGRLARRDLTGSRLAYLRQQAPALTQRPLSGALAGMLDD
jgi:hypothetical protein